MLFCPAWPVRPSPQGEWVLLTVQIVIFMNKTPIAWTEWSWNPVTGCTHAGTDECDECYAKVMARRLQAMGKPRYANGFQVTLHPEALDEPLAFDPNKEFMCFLPSMGDLFHPLVPDSFIDQVMSVIWRTPNGTYQILTKRSARMAQYFATHPCPPNAWLGVTCGCKKSLFRVDDLRHIAAPVRWLSIEPCLDDLANGGLDLTNIDWIVVGGESGPSARRMFPAWPMYLKDLADASGTTFFFKQWGSIGADGIRRSKSANGHLLGGVEYFNYPTPRVNY